VPRSSKTTAVSGFVTPMAAQPVAALPDGDDWLYELKLDGYRALLLKNGEHVSVQSRNRKDLTRMYPTVAAAARELKAKHIVLDGEIVAVDESGRPSFQALQHRTLHATHTVVYYAFDLLAFNGQDLTRQPLMKRRAQLAKILPPDAADLRLLQPLPGTATEIVQAVRAMGLEGVVAKRKTSVYRAGERSDDWQKLKLERAQEFVVGGYRLASPASIDALLVGYYEGKALRFAAKVRAGLIPHLRRSLLETLKPLAVGKCPFSNLPDADTSRWGGGVTQDEMNALRWVKPKLVAQIRFVEWTAEGRLRHSKFLGLRHDKSAKEVVRE
jgi:bifunctional non-homologous end joining protein LigD